MRCSSMPLSSSLLLCLTPVLLAQPKPLQPGQPLTPVDKLVHYLQQEQMKDSFALTAQRRQTLKQLATHGANARPAINVLIREMQQKAPFPGKGGQGMKEWTEDEERTRLARTALHRIGPPAIGPLLDAGTFAETTRSGAGRGRLVTTVCLFKGQAVPELIAALKSKERGRQRFAILVLLSMGSHAIGAVKELKRLEVEERDWQVKSLAGRARWDIERQALQVQAVGLIGGAGTGPLPAMVLASNLPRTAPAPNLMANRLRMPAINLPQWDQGRKKGWFAAIPLLLKLLIVGVMAIISVGGWFARKFSPTKDDTEVLVPQTASTQTKPSGNRCPGCGAYYGLESVRCSQCGQVAGSE